MDRACKWLWNRASTLTKVQLTLGVLLMSGSVLLGGVSTPVPEEPRTVLFGVQPKAEAEPTPVITVNSKRAAVLRAVGLVNDHVHTPAALPKLKVIWDGQLDAQGQLICCPAEGSTLVLNPAMNRAQQVYTALHEIGHYLEFQGAVEITPVVRAMRRTPTVVGLFKDRQAGDEWSAYAMEPTELFARGFAQWIALRSGDRQAIIGVRAFGAGQWPDKEFGPVAEAFENLQGWY